MPRTAGRVVPVAIIGAGPVGLAAAARLVAAGIDFAILERGSEPAAGVATWAHVPMFSPWSLNADRVARENLTRRGHHVPDDGYPTGDELRTRYLLPLAELPDIASRLLLRRRVIAVTRQSRNRSDGGRLGRPFEIRFSSAGHIDALLASTVIDASGAAISNPVGASGIPAAGERDAGDRIIYGIPDVLGERKAALAGTRVTVFGSGHSAMTVIGDLGRVKVEAPDTTIRWVTRRTPRGANRSDALPKRSSLAGTAHSLVQNGVVQPYWGYHAARIERRESALVVVAAEGELPPSDWLIAATGARPDLTFLSELQLALDPALETPVALAPLIDPRIHDCLTVPLHGADVLGHPEPGIYSVGAKSFGRAPNFLLDVGYTQIESVVAAVAGRPDHGRWLRATLCGPAECTPVGPALTIQSPRAAYAPDESAGPSSACDQPCASGPQAQTAAPSGRGVRD